MTKSRYRPEFAVIAKEMSDAGCFDWQIARRLGVSDNTIHKWKEKYPPFGNALHRRPGTVFPGGNLLAIRDRLAPLLAKGFTSLEIARFEALLTGRRGWIKQFLVNDRRTPPEVLAIAKEVLTWPTRHSKATRWERENLGNATALSDEVSTNALEKPRLPAADAAPSRLANVNNAGRAISGGTLAKPYLPAPPVSAVSSSVASVDKPSKMSMSTGKEKAPGGPTRRVLASVKVSVAALSAGETNKHERFPGAGFDGSEVDGGL